MPDWPASNTPEGCTPLFINTNLPTYFVASLIRTTDQISTPATLTWVANLAIYQSFVLPWPYTIRRFFWVNGSTLTGPPNLDIGVFSPDGTKLVSTGNTVQAGVSAVQFANASVSPYRLGAGRYFLGISSSGSTSCLYNYGGLSVGPLALCQVFQQATANPLPAAATFARAANALMPYGGFTRTASGF